MSEHTPHWSKDVETRNTKHQIDVMPAGKKVYIHDTDYGSVSVDVDRLDWLIDTLVLAKEQVTRE